MRCYPRTQCYDGEEAPIAVRMRCVSGHDIMLEDGTHVCTETRLPEAIGKCGTSGKYTDSEPMTAIRREWDEGVYKYATLRIPRVFSDVPLEC